MPELLYTTPAEKIKPESLLFGKKTTRLAFLTQQQFPIPRFVDVSTLQLKKIYEHPSPDSQLLILQEEIQKMIPAHEYAVRSSGLHEDSSTSAHAGEFHTELSVSPQKIADAVNKVVADALSKKQSLSEFSLIIQEYVIPTHAGVMFTRNPLGGTESILEWHTGTTPDVVMGKSSEQIKLFRNAVPKRKYPVSFVAELLAASLRIELLYEHPQDIEWVYNGHTLFIVQTRPITTITQGEHLALIEAENFLRSRPQYFLERTEIAASYPTPSRLLFDLLTVLTGENGPTRAVYKKFGITVGNGLPLMLIQNQLFIDKEVELQQFFPSLSYFTGEPGTPHIARLRGMIRTYKNTNAIKKISTVGTSALLTQKIIHAIQHVEQTPQPTHPVDALNALIDMYPLIFTCNLLCLANHTETEKILPVNSPTLVQFGSYKLHSMGSQTLGLLPPKEKMFGNSLNIEDESLFQTYHVPHVEEGGAIAAWWAVQDPQFITVLEKKLQEFRNFERLREGARWLTVLLVHRLRNALKESVARKGFTWSSVFYESTLSEMLEEQYDTSLLSSRHAERTKNVLTLLPSQLSTFPIIEKKEKFSVSGGTASGCIVTEADYLSHTYTTKQKPILLTKTLHPGLASLLPHIAGIVSCEGSLLAHLAIMAREARVPVLIWPHADKEFSGETNVLLDANTIKITKLGTKNGD